MNNTINRILNLVTEASISKMVRRGDYDDNGTPQTAQAAYKLKSSRKRAKKRVRRSDGSTIGDGHMKSGEETGDMLVRGNPDDTSRLRTPKPLKKKPNPTGSKAAEKDKNVNHERAAALAIRTKRDKIKKKRLSGKFPASNLTSSERYGPNGTPKLKFKNPK